MTLQLASAAQVAIARLERVSRASNSVGARDAGESQGRFAWRWRGQLPRLSACATATPCHPARDFDGSGR